MLLVISMTWRQLEDDLTDRYFCLTNILDNPAILQPTVQVAGLALAVRSASHTEHLLAPSTSTPEAVYIVIKKVLRNVIMQWNLVY
jgi:hypothetical protein